MSFLTSEASFECIWTSLLGLVSIREEFDYIKDRIEIFIALVRVFCQTGLLFKWQTIFLTKYGSNLELVLEASPSIELIISRVMFTTCALKKESNKWYKHLKPPVEDLT